MKGDIRISKCAHGTGWEAIAGDRNDCGENCSFNIDAEAVEDLINEINKAAVAGAPWPVYDVSDR